MGKLLLLENVDGPQEGCSERNTKMTARLLSSYNNNSNNPQRGTDLLRDAW
nr:hypothetical protein [Mycobacterium sp. ST-F2]